MDVADVESQHRYQPTRTPCAVYSVGNEYFTAAPAGKKPKTSTNTNIYGFWNWVYVPDKTVEHYGYEIWKHVEAEN